MVNYFLLKTDALPLDYGIGAYMTDVENALLTSVDVNVHILDITAAATEFTYSKKRTYEYYQFPMAAIKPKIPSRELDTQFAHSVADILSNYLINCSNIILHINYSALYFFAEVFKTRFNAKILSTIHSIDWKFFFTTDRERFLKCMVNNIESKAISSTHSEKRLCNISDQLIFVTQYGLNFFKSTYGISDQKSNVIYNGVNLSRRSFPGHRRKLEAKLAAGFKKEDFIILFVGRPTEEKGFTPMIKGVIQSIKVNKNIKLIVAGGFSKEQQLFADKYPNNIYYTGYLNKIELNKYYLAADLGIIASLFEQCSYVALEMVNNSVPIIASNVDGLKEIFADGATAIKVDPKIGINGEINIDYKAISSKINLASTSPKILSSLTTNAKHMMISKFDKADMIKKTLEVIYKL